MKQILITLIALVLLLTSCAEEKLVSGVCADEVYSRYSLTWDRLDHVYIKEEIHVPYITEVGLILVTKDAERVAATMLPDTLEHVTIDSVNTWGNRATYIERTLLTQEYRPCVVTTYRR